MSVISMYACMVIFCPLKSINMRSYLLIFSFACTRVYMHAYMCMFMFVHTFLHVCIVMLIYDCVCIQVHEWRKGVGMLVRKFACLYRYAWHIIETTTYKKLM